MYFSDRINRQNGSQPQPFYAEETEFLTVSISLGLIKAMTIGVFGGRSTVILNPLGDLLVGIGPSLGNSAGGVFVVAFGGIVRPPR